MPHLLTQSISQTECIGDSLDDKINPNFLKLDEAVQSLSADGAISNRNVATNAAISGTKILPNFGSQNIITTGFIGVGTISPTVSIQSSDGTDSSDRRIRVGTTARNIELIRNGSDDNWVRSTGNSSFILDQASSGNLILRTNSIERVRIDSSGKVGINTSSPGARLTIQNGTSMSNTSQNWANISAIQTRGSFGGAISLIDTASGASGYCLYTADYGADFYIQGADAQGGEALNGGVFLNNRASSWSSASDERQKTIIENITDACDKIKTLRTVIGRYNWDNEETRRPFLIAQDVQQVLPEAVCIADKQTPEQYLGLSYTDTIPLLVAAIKELIDENKNLKERIELLNT